MKATSAVDTVYAMSVFLFKQGESDPYSDDLQS